MDFRNLKTHIIGHIRKNTHKWSMDFKELKSQEEQEENKKQEAIGLSVTWIAYTAVKEDKCGKQYERQIDLNNLNGANVGYTNHSEFLCLKHYKRKFQTS